jgi:hypothetical protein
MATHDPHPAIDHDTYYRILEYLGDARAHPGTVTLTPEEVAAALDCPSVDAQSALYRLHTRLEWLSDAGAGQYRVDGRGDA